MSKISLETLSEVLQEEGVEQPKQIKILEHLQQILKEEKEEKETEKLPRQKNQLGVIILDELNEVKTNNLSALVYEISANESHDKVIENLNKAVKEFNNTKKGQKQPIKSVSEAFQFIKPKIFKSNNLKRKTKEPVRCLISLNKV